MKGKTNFDNYLKEQLKDSSFKRRFEEAGKNWDVALKLASLREKAGMSQKELAEKVGTTQQQISRLESPGYEGHSMRLLKRVAHALHTELEVSFRPTGSK